MKEITNKARGYNVKIKVFEKLDEVQKSFEESEIVGIVNRQLVAHGWNSQFERELVKHAITTTGTPKLTKEGKKGPVVAESDSQYLKRTGFKVDLETAQSIANGIAYPPEAGERGESGLVKLARKQLEAARDAGRLDEVVEKLKTMGLEIDDEEEDDDAVFEAAVRFRAEMLAEI